jgi:hypothetical protein
MRPHLVAAVAFKNHEPDRRRDRSLSPPTPIDSCQYYSKPMPNLNCLQGHPRNRLGPHQRLVIDCQARTGGRRWYATLPIFGALPARGESAHGRHGGPCTPWALRGLTYRLNFASGAIMSQEELEFIRNARALLIFRHEKVATSRRTVEEIALVTLATIKQSRDLMSLADKVYGSPLIAGRI